MIQVALYKPETDGNVGAVARVMKNFGFSELILVDPQCDHLSDESLRRSRHAEDILRNAKIQKDLGFVKKFNVVVGTTAVVGTDYNIPRSPIELANFISEFSRISGCGFNEFLSDKKNKMLLLFGPESSGLMVDELKKCDYLITIPTSESYRALNLSHAVGIVLYEFSKVLGFPEKSSSSKTRKGCSPRQGIVEMAERSEKERLNGYSGSAISKLYAGDSKIHVVNDSMKKMIFKSILTKREVFALMGFFKNIERYTNRERLPERRNSGNNAKTVGKNKKTRKD